MKRFIVALATLVTVGFASPGAGQEFVVVVNAANPASELSKDEVSKIFLKRQVKWSTGDAVVAVDLGKGTSVRDAFSRGVHGRRASAIVSHWQQQIFSGREVPPAEQSSEADALAFVRSNPHAIGYVSAEAELGSGVKKVTIK